MPSRQETKATTVAYLRAGIDRATKMASTAPKAAAKSAVFIGVHTVMVDALAPQYDRTVTASKSPTYPKRNGTPVEWRAQVLAIIAESDNGERPVVSEALILAATGARCTVYVDTMALGVRAAQDAGKMWEQYPTIASAEGWAQFVSIARSMGAVIVNL